MAELITSRVTPLTPSQVNKAGRTLRRWQSADPVEPDDREIKAAIDVMLRFRAAHAYSLTKATMGLRSMVNTERCPVEVSQRLKRASTIMDKLSREPTLALSTMQDIGGCRALFDSIAELRRVEHRLRKNRPPLRVKDYVKKPRASGYRAVHVVVTYPDEWGEDRAVEVQLRTRTMHEWAIAVERLSGQQQVDLKSGIGPHELLDLMEAVSEAMALEEEGAIVPRQLGDKIAALREAAVPYLGRMP